MNAQTPDQTPEPVPQARPNVVEYRTLREVDVNGIPIHTARVGAPPACSLPPDEYEARMTALEAKYAEEEARLAEAVATHKPPPNTVPRFHKPSLPGDVSYLDLKVVDCRRCRRTCLAPCDEPFRAECAGKDHAGTAYLPPPVGGTLWETCYHAGSPQVVRFFVCKRCRGE